MSDDDQDKPKRWIDWFDVRQKTISGLLVGALIAAAAGLGPLVYNHVSQGGLVRLLGGVTIAEIEPIVRKASEEAQKEVRRLAVPAQGAIIPFDGPCPTGWSMAKDIVGSAIVGAGATKMGESGLPIGNLYTYEGTGSFAGDPKKVGRKPFDPGYDLGGYDPTAKNGSDDWEPISRYVTRVKTSLIPTFYPLLFCKYQG